MRDREQEAPRTTAPDAAAPAATDLRTLAAQLGNAGFRVARAARPSGVVHPLVRALTAARVLARTPLSDAIHAAGTGSFAPAFALLQGLSVNATNNALRQLSGADLVALRSHLGEAPAADSARITNAIDALLLWSDADATAVSTTYATGTYTVGLTGDVRQTHDYALWRRRAVQALNSKPAAEKAAGNAWLAAYEAHEEWSVRGGTGPEPAAAGAVPAAFSALGAPPTPSIRVVHSYSVTLPGTTTAINYRDDPVAPTYQYLISETGVAHAGTKLSARPDRVAIFTAAGIADATAQKVMTKVSTLEGGLEAVNTYDTGYISVGFIQFTSGQTGTGSLAGVLREMRTANAAEFNTYFHSLGIDVDSQGLTVVDPASGTILRGADAVTKVMDDKRLTAVFQRAGTDSQAFQAAQVKRAHDEYYLAPQAFTVTQGGVAIAGSYQDVLTSEAGKTALMDRAVQRGVGNARQTFRDACKAVMTAHGAQTLADLASYETEIVPPLINRMDVLHQTDLTQPPAAPAATPTTPATVP